MVDLQSDLDKRKDGDQASLSSSTVLEAISESIPVTNKIDFYGTLFILWFLFENGYMVVSLYFEHIEVDVPYEMLVHGPLRYFPKEAEFGSRFNCSPLFKTFLNNPAYLTDDFMGEELTKGKSEAFLQVDEVVAELERLRNESNITMVRLGIRLVEVCEIRLPQQVQQGCISYDTITNDCLQGDCHEGVFLCWWNGLNALRFILFARIGTFLPAVAVICLCMFDPPPVGFKFLARPWIAATSLCLSSLFGSFYLAFAMKQIQRYVNQEIFFLSYPGDDENPPYNYYLGYVFGRVMLGTIVNFIFGFCYWYVYIFTPPYPRHPSRFLHRRGYFQQQLKYLRDEYGNNPRHKSFDTASSTAVSEA